MKTQRIPMTIEEFETMPHRLGWKHEYWDGMARLSPSHTAIATVKMTIAQRTIVDPPCEIRPLNEDDTARLHPAYVAAFHDTIDYCNRSLASVKVAAVENLQNYFTEKRGKRLDASRIAIYRKRVVGAALIVEKKDGQPFLYLLFVVPKWQRKGVANALMSEVMNVLYAAGYTTLTSRYMLGNDESRAWHERFGFVLKPDIFVAGHYYRHAAQEYERHKLRADLPQDQLDLLEKRQEAWLELYQLLESSPSRYGDFDL